MPNEVLAKLSRQAFSSILVEMSSQELAWLVRSEGHLSLLVTRRATVIVTRARLVAGLFAVLTPLWIVIDALTFPAAIWQGLALMRVAATIGFVAILLAMRRMTNAADAHRALSALLAVPTVFFFFSFQHVAHFELQGNEVAFAIAYTFLPFVMLAGLAIFPLTLLESLAFAAPMLLMHILAAAMRQPEADWPIVAASFWLLVLIAAVSALAGISQLAFMMVLVREAIRDRMTGCFSRHSGEELLELQFNQASRIKSPLSLAFIDLDHFKQINDRFGHEAGDKVLADTAGKIREQLRTGDILIRWGGEEFVVIMPNINAQQACHALSRLRDGGFGQRPDGTPITASIGVAEHFPDGAGNWQQLVEKADARMYEAKQAGRNCIVGYVSQPGLPHERPIPNPFNYCRAYPASIHSNGIDS